MTAATLVGLPRRGAGTPDHGKMHLTYAVQQRRDAAVMYGSEEPTGVCDGHPIQSPSDTLIRNAPARGNSAVASQPYASTGVSDAFECAAVGVRK
ncbi:MAG: hypothetical protein M3Y18_09475 [Candidatus Eremiobacteraeota bacterium]|nr:hypothetical protein [Candidatus Eremiobacteraeota bacterium]